MIILSFVSETNREIIYTLADEIDGGGVVAMREIK